ncbi:MAG: PEGA domain-containing protein [Candidatus Micrarchaeota archaeon]|nr:PEGA domain-containing protein [Candidatus Micrarchaeota archaeon]
MKRVMVVALLAFLSIILVNNVKATASVLKVYSTPDGGYVSIDDVTRGQTPLSIGLVPGKHIISVTKEGYPDYKSSVITVAGETQFLNITLKK